MIVMIDVGNSAIKVARAEGTEIRFRHNVPSEPTTDDGTRSAVALRIVAEAVAAGAAGIVLVSVVPAWTAAISQSASNLSLPLLVADHGTIPMAFGVTQPASLGADRLLNAYAATRLHGTPVIVVDLGTATTVDAVDASGAFVGGTILPGIELGARALANGTAQLPYVRATTLPAAVGRNTRDAMTSGLVLGHIGAVRELVDRMVRELWPGEERRPTVVVTGGASRACWSSEWVAAFGKGPPIADIVDPDLTLRGLSLLHAELARLPG